MTRRATETPYGSWASPIDSATASGAAARIDEVRIDGDDVLWSETRPEEEGRTTLLRRGPGGFVREVTPAPFDARTGVHEYGGGAWNARGGEVVFSHFADGRLYRTDASSAPRAITPDTGGRLRYADLQFDPARRRILCVREDHRRPGEPVNALVAVPLDGGESEGRVLTQGNDFYAAPRPSPDGTRLAWQTWDHPHMPWDGARLRVATLEADGGLGGARTVAGGPDEAAQQPVWTPEGDLVFVSDRSGWWNPYRWDGRAGEGDAVALYPSQAEFGVPQWSFGISTLGMAPPRTLVCLYGGRLGRLDLDTLEMHEVATPYRRLTGLRTDASGRYAVLIGGSPSRPDEVVRVDLATDATEPLVSSAKVEVDARYLSEPERIRFSTEGDRQAFAWYYPPTNPDHVAPEGERPLLLVKSHGGPTSAARIGFDLGVQYWTSRGFAVVDVDYGGSTGMGREYRERLDGAWGVVDVDDCCNAARFLVREGKADPERLCIHGRSAGGFTTLCALAFRDVFAAGGSHFGVSDLEGMVRDTHKFESRYFDRLVGPYPEAREVYRERSPIHAAERLDRPMIFFQGDEDAVVPPDQAERMVEVLRAKGVPVAYRSFRGEAHGFRKDESIRATLDEEFTFYARVFGFEPADGFAPIEIDNEHALPG